jgi:membrane protein
MQMKQWLSLFRDTFSCWTAHKAPKMGAALAFYSALSLAPLVVLALSMASLVFERDSARTELIAQAASYIGSEGAALIGTILESNAREGANWWKAILGFAVVLFGASGVFGELQDSLNRIWDAQPKTGHAIRNLVKTRLLSFTMVFLIGVLLLASIVASTMISAADKFVSGWLPGTAVLLQLANTVVSLAVVAVLFATVFRVLPDARIGWRDVWLGALLTAVLFVVGKYLLGLYLGKSAVGSSYGAAGSLVVILVWVYYSAQVLFFGAEFTRIYALRHGTHQHTAAAKELATGGMPGA